MPASAALTTARTERLKPFRFTKENARAMAERANQYRRVVKLACATPPTLSPDELYQREQIGWLKGAIRRIDVALQHPRSNKPRDYRDLILARREACKMLEKITSTPPAPAIVNAPTLLEPQATVATPAPQAVVGEAKVEETKPASG